MQREPAKFRELQTTVGVKRKLQVAVLVSKGGPEVESALKKRKTSGLAAEAVSCMLAGSDSPVTPVLEEGARSGQVGAAFGVEDVQVHSNLFTHPRLPRHMSAHTHESARNDNTAHMQDHHHQCLPCSAVFVATVSLE